MDEREYWRGQFCRIMALNEVLFGQSRDRVEEMLHQTGIQLDVDLDRPMTLCLTGLEKRLYTARLGMSRQAFISLTQRLDQRLRELFAHLGCPMECKVVQYDQSKQLCYLFPAVGLSLSAAEIAGVIQQAVMETYRDCPGFREGAIPNVTALIERVEHYEELAGAFRRARYLNRCAFFLMESRVMDEETLARLRHPCALAQLTDLFDRLDQAVNRGEKAAVEESLRAIFLTHLRKSFDFDLTKDVLSELRKRLERYGGVFQLDLRVGIDGLFVKNYATVEELFRAALALFHICAAATATWGRGVSSLVLEAMYYIRGNFNRDLGLEEVAGHVGISGGYLSRMFNQEVGESLPAYLTRIRMNRAATLLEQGVLRVGEIGKEVGIPNPQYFGALFRKQMGVAPQEYRRSYRADRDEEAE